MSLKLFPLVSAASFFAVGVASGQQAASSIMQSRLFANPSAPAPTAAYDTNRNASPGSAGSDATGSSDNSFGAQIILKNQERPTFFNVFGDVSGFYTTNVDLTPHGGRSDFFLASNVGAGWRPTISRELAGEIMVATSVFRYDRASDLDFERISAGTGLSWLVSRTPGIVAFARYDFTELLHPDGNQLLQDHGFTIGGQKTFVFGRSHFLTTGVIGMLGKSVPRSQERNQAGVNAGYHLQITRSLDADLVYRYAAQFYTEGGRVDHNQALSLAIGFYANRWLRVDATISAARNDTNRPVFEYEVLTLGSGVRFNVRF